MIDKIEIEKIWLGKLKPKRNKRKHRYLHFDFRIEEPQKKLSLVSNSNSIASHAFLPFVKFNKSKIKYKFSIKKGKRVLEKRDNYGKPKVRPIMYAGHLDTLIYVWYQCILEKDYENILERDNLRSTALAYRSIEKEDNSGGKCNIEFANEIFSFIREKGEECVALTFDIEKFFENLSHSFLKKKWCEILGVDILPLDHYNVWKSLTKYSSIELTPEVKKILKINTKGLEAHAKSFGGYEKFSGKKFRELKKEIRKLEKTKGSILCQNRNQKGIPQGSPMSGLLANIYLIDFDRAMNEIVNKAGGIYRRYSDDIIIVCPVKEAEKLENATMGKILSDKDSNNNSYLIINKNKTSKIFFLKDNGKLTSWKIEKDPATNAIVQKRKSLQYLGFEFDGQKVFLRAGSVAKFYHKLKYRLRKIKEHHLNKKGPLLKEKLFRKHSKFGKSNFFSYVRKSKKAIPNNKFKKQLKKHLPIIKKAIFPD